jgi:SMI1-KNR4 cell-wall
VNISECYEKYCEIRFPLPSEEAIRSFENTVDVVLPESYRKFLADYNGGKFSEPSFSAEWDDEVQGDRLSILYGLNQEVPGRSLTDKSLLAIYPASPRKVLPIGHTMMNNLLLLVTDVNDSEFGTVLMKPAWIEWTWIIADDIYDFFSLIE